MTYLSKQASEPAQQSVQLLRRGQLRFIILSTLAAHTIPTSSETDASEVIALSVLQLFQLAGLERSESTRQQCIGALERAGLVYRWTFEEHTGRKFWTITDAGLLELNKLKARFAGAAA